MKKILFIILVAFSMQLGVISTSEAKFSAGLRVGFNASKYTGDFASNSKFAPGFHIGPYFRVSIKEKYRVQADLLFSTKGDVTVFGGVKYYDIPFYIDVPVMFNYKPIAGLYVEAGVQPSFALTTLAFDKNSSSEFLSNADTNIKTAVFAPIAGVGYEFKKVSLGVRSTFASSNISNSSTFKQSNLTLMATFAFKF